MANNQQLGHVKQISHKTPSRIQELIKRLAQAQRKIRHSGRGKAYFERRPE